MFGRPACQVYAPLPKLSSSISFMAASISSPSLSPEIYSPSSPFFTLMYTELPTPIWLLNVTVVPLIGIMVFSPFSWSRS